jgi:hypothetical protein
LLLSWRAGTSFVDDSIAVVVDSVAADAIEDTGQRPAVGAAVILADVHLLSASGHKGHRREDRAHQSLAAFCAFHVGAPRV